MRWASRLFSLMMQRVRFSPSLAPMKKLLLLLVLATVAPGVRAADPLSRIGFGSCANENRPQPIWKAINQLKPELFILMGDNVYADTADAQKLEEAYAKLGHEEGFSALRNSCPIVATWDDHDYGKNDGGAEWEGKTAAKKAFMKFFDTPAGSPLRERGGVYDSHIFGPKGKRVQVILLDTRWFRGPLERLDKEELKKLRAEKGQSQGPYLAAKNSDSTMLGEKQWAWLTQELKKPAELRLIVTSIQAIPVDHGYEKWGNLPKERKRLLDTIRDNATGVVLLSGDRHAGDISRLPPETNGGPFFPLYEATASGLNQKSTTKETNRYRVLDEEPFGDSNFGWIEIDWKKEDPSVKLEIRDTDGKVVRETDFTLGELKPCSL